MKTEHEGSCGNRLDERACFVWPSAARSQTDGPAAINFSRTNFSRTDVALPYSSVGGRLRAIKRSKFALLTLLPSILCAVLACNRDNGSRSRDCARIAHALATLGNALQISLDDVALPTSAQPASADRLVASASATEPLLSPSDFENPTTAAIAAQLAASLALVSSSATELKAAALASIWATAQLAQIEERQRTQGEHLAQEFVSSLLATGISSEEITRYGNMITSATDRSLAASKSSLEYVADRIQQGYSPNSEQRLHRANAVGSLRKAAALVGEQIGAKDKSDLALVTWVRALAKFQKTRENFEAVRGAATLGCGAQSPN